MALSFKHQALCLGIAALTGAAYASSSTVSRRLASPAPAPAAKTAPVAPSAEDAEACLARAVCGLKRKIGSRKKTWTPALCQQVARTVVDSAARHGLSQALLLAVMVQESDLDDTAARESRSRGRVARDSGLMGIRCVMDRRGRCTNGLVKGMAWRQVMNPLTNIALGARYLAHYRDSAMRCKHRDHAYWAHYNHGTRYISRGVARLYPRHVAALYSALGETLGLDTSELARQQTSPPGRRSFELSAAIHGTRTSCPATAPASPLALD